MLSICTRIYRDGEEFPVVVNFQTVSYWPGRRQTQFEPSEDPSVTVELFSAEHGVAEGEVTPAALTDDELNALQTWLDADEDGEIYGLSARELECRSHDLRREWRRKPHQRAA